MEYQNIGAALEYYRSKAYVYVPDAPWCVGKYAYYATRPKGSTDVRCDINSQMRGFLVASGEQSFIQLMLDGTELKRHVCVTPCFRVEKYNDWHKPYFMKVELINAHDVDEGHLVDMIHDACGFFDRYFSTRVVKTEIGYDIVEKGTRAELGSYGIRDHVICGKRYRWIYGTGCAEPRLSTAVMRHNTEVGR